MMSDGAHVPTEQELSDLYEDVWKAYSEAHIVPKIPVNMNNIASANPSPAPPQTTASPLQNNDPNDYFTRQTLVPPPPPPPLPPPTPPSVTPPTQRRYRPLPPIPRGSLLTSPSPPMIPPYSPPMVEPASSSASSAFPGPISIAPSNSFSTIESGEKTVTQLHSFDHFPNLPMGARPPTIPGLNHVGMTNGYSSPSAEDNAANVQYSLPYRTSPETLAYTQATDGGPLTPHSSSQYSLATNPQMTPWNTSPEIQLTQLAASSNYGLLAHSSPNIQLDQQTLSMASPSDDSVFFDPGPSFNTRPVIDYGRVLADVGRFPNNTGETIDDVVEVASEEDDPMRFVNWALLSHVAVRLRDKVPRSTHVKGSIPYPRAFTGKDIVVTIHAQIQRELVVNLGGSAGDRRAALHVARSLQSQLFFYEVEWNSRTLQDGVEDVYMFMDDQEGDDAPIEREELPTGVITYLTRCYAPDCGGAACYSYSCPHRTNSLLQQLPDPLESSPEPSTAVWAEKMPPEIIQALPEREVKRQTIIHTLITKEEQYIKDLDILESIFIKPLQKANPPVISPLDLEEFIDQVFHNILDIRECNRRLLEVLYVRQREQGPVIERIGDVFLDAATEFRNTYPTYVGHHPIAEKRVKEELERNSEFRLFIERCSRQRLPRSMEGSRLLDLRHYLSRPAEHLQKYPVLLDAIVNETHKNNPDRDFLQEAIDAIKNLQQVAQLRTFQSAMGKGFTGKWEWNDLVSREMIKGLTKEEIKRQSVIFELIKGEMAYVRDLEVIENLYVQPLRNVEPLIILPDNLDRFIRDVFSNFAELHAHHRRLLDGLHEIQREEHPRIRSITAALFDAALNFREAYMEYIPNYPIAEYRIDDELARNPRFRSFYDQCSKHPDAGRLDMKNFINRPIPRLLRYELLLRNIHEDTPSLHDDRESIPQVIEVIKALGKETEPGVQSAKLKVEVWRYNSDLVFKSGEFIDMDLLNEQRSLLHTGKLLRPPEGGLTTWTEVFVLLFDNYLVLTKVREKEGITKYHVNKRPIPLDLLALYNFSDPPLHRATGILRNFRGGGQSTENPLQEGSDSRLAFPMTLLHTGRAGGMLVLYTESAAIREEWKQKLEEALGLRTVVQESNKVFEIETLSIETFLMYQGNAVQLQTPWKDGNHSLTGKVTCSVPFTTADGRALVAVGCDEGLWMGFRHDSRSMQRVLHIKKVTQCEMLDEFGVFLVLADKVLFAYHIEALVPSNPNMAQPLQKMNTIVHKEIQFFRSGKLNGRTLVVFMRKDGSNSHFYVVEPVFDKINEKAKAPSGIASRILGSKTSWFRDYRRFIHTCEAYDVVFLKAKLGILCSRGFEILETTGFQDIVNIPLHDDARLSHMAKRCESCRPIGMFRSAENEFLLCYNEFGVYVNKRGIPNRPSTGTGTIEWEGRAESVAIHPPYILLFDNQFIEIRHIKTGRLAQIIQGSDVRFLWNSLGPDSSAAIVPSGGAEDHTIQEPRVHAVMSIHEPGMHPNGRAAKPISQHIFELIPTIPLYLPGSLASPSTMTYFPQSYSPPRSPPLRANHLIR
ncbi:hypothetical protein AX17_005945 [Amanita inopinata Kibby_2008]|nr:hypothetical protein AX17_005945 [Amanita inopinata Kibby_2008]